MPQLAFFPWIKLECDIAAGEYSLRRFVRGRRPGPDGDCQETLDAILAPYRDLEGKPVKTAVILAPQGQELTADLSEENRADLFVVAELFAFAALASRDFFAWNYCNRDDLRLVIQAFTDPRGGAFMELRRRDGTKGARVTGEYYRVQVPAHVNHSGWPIKVDRALLDALLAARERDEWSGLYRGIVLFNQANTDAPDMSPNTKLVLTYAALEQILGTASRKRQRRFPEKFAEAWRPSRELPSNEWRPPPSGTGWKKDSLRAYWASDLKICRGNLAHGHREVSLPSQWTVLEHLLLSSFAIPRLVKQVLSKMDLYAPTDEDERDINALEPLLNLPSVFAELDPNDDEDGFPNAKFAWQRVLRREGRRQLEEFFEKKAEELLRQQEEHEEGS